MNSKTAEALYISLQNRANGYRKKVDNDTISLSVRNDWNNILTGIMISQSYIVEEFKLNEAKLKLKMLEYQNDHVNTKG